MRLQFARALLVGGDLRLEVVDVLQRIARGVGAAAEQRIKLLLAEPAALDQQEIVDVDAFFEDVGRARAHRARRDAADVGVMAARGDPEQDRLARVVEHRRADGDVGQMRAAVVGRVEREDVAGADACPR